MLFDRIGQCTKISFLLLKSAALTNVYQFRLYAKTSVVLEKISSNPVEKRSTNSERTILEKVLIKDDDKPNTTTEKVKKGVTTSFYFTIGGISVAAICVLVYCLFDNLYATNSPQRIYSTALKMIKNDVRCKEILGSSIKGHGEDTGRGRRRHIINKRYFKDNEERVRIIFHVKGDKAVGDATAEIACVNGTWDYRFLFVETKTSAPEVVIIIDNRTI